MRNKNIGMFSSVGVAALLLLATGCQTTSSTHDERSEGRVIDDKEITSNVEKNLDRDPTYKFTDVNVQTFAGVVQLSGFVNIAAQKQRAQEIAQNIDGVQKVDNGLTLKPMAATGRQNSSQPIYSEPENQATPSDNK